jgi:hypothetical protein
MLLVNGPIEVTVIVVWVRDPWGRIIEVTGADKLKSRGTPIIIMTGA